MKGIWDKIISEVKEQPRDFHTVPKTNKNPLWFHATSDGTYIYITDAKNHDNSSRITGARSLSYVEFLRIYPLYLKRCRGEAVSIEAAKATKNQVYWYGIFNEIIKEENYGRKEQNVDREGYNTTEERATAYVTIKSICEVHGYQFQFVQSIEPKRDETGTVIEYLPQDSYNNRNNLYLSKEGKGPFCKFSIDCPPKSGVYLMIVNNEIIYIGETSNLSQRFNQGYGDISPRNCFIGGQTTNCKMNATLLNYFKNKQKVDLFFYETNDYKEIELKLLRKIKTKYNVKDN